MTIALTVDVEDYFQVSAFENTVPVSSWESWPQRAGQNTHKVLDIFAEYELKATFFVLGWVAQRHPQVVRRMAAEGHEVCCHGFAHARITTMNPQSFLEDITRARYLLQDISGQPVLGYRAPSYTITPKTLWALDALIEAGFSYDSSIFPIYHDVYGMPGAKRFPHILTREKGTLREFPPSTLAFSLLGKKLILPFSGGGYLRLLPVQCISWAFSQLEKDHKPCTLYFHPWEIDPEQPPMQGPLKSRFRHYVNLARTESKLRTLFARHSFAPMGHILQEVLPHA